jgi:hypothetical protein
LDQSEDGMRRYARKRWVGVCLLGVTLGGGCNYSIQRPAPECCCNQFTIHPAGVRIDEPADKLLYPARKAPVARPTELPSPSVVQHSGSTAVIAPVPAAAVTAPAASRFEATTSSDGGPSETRRPITLVMDTRPVTPKKKHGTPRSRPVLTLDTSDPNPPPVVQAALPAGPAPATPAAIQRVAAEESVFERPKLPARRGFVDLTAQTWFSRAEDHSWLTGQVLYARTTNTWRLHYASLDDNDPYGGTVTLAGEQSLQGLKDGQHVRVHGCLVDPDRREAGSTYRVSSLEVVEHAH